MPEEAFSLKVLGAMVAKALGLTIGDNVEIRRDKVDGNRILVIRHPRQEGSAS